MSSFALFLVPYTFFIGFILYAILSPPIASSSSLQQGIFLRCLQNLSVHLLGNKATNGIDKIVHQVLYKRSRFFVGVYITLILWGWGVMFVFGYEHIRTDLYGHHDLWPHHKLIGIFVFASCLGSFAGASWSTAGNITPVSLSRYGSCYPYDGVLYFPGRKCSTISGVVRLARSKYDRVTQRHVPRFDHYCSWVDNSVGEENYRFFLLFLVVHTVMLWYGAYIIFRIFRILYKTIESDDNVVFMDRRTGLKVESTSLVILRYLCQRHFALGILAMLLLIMAVMVGLFLMFHIYLTCRGMTTNEFFKWRKVKKFHNRAVQEYNQAAKAGLQTEKMKNSKKDNITISIKELHIGNGDAIVGCTGMSMVAPMKSTMELTRDAKNTQEKIKRSTQNNECTDLALVPLCHPGPMPKNIYDKGIVENLSQVIHPLSLRKEAMDRQASFLNESKKASRE